MEKTAADRAGKVNERERLRLLRAFDDVVPRIPRRAAAAVDKELKSVRTARRRGGRRHGRLG